MSDTVKMKLTFPRGKQMPGEVVEVAADEVHRWKGFAELVEDKPKDEAKADEAAKTSADKNPTTGSVPQKAAGK
ncbi:hypothetical protein [Streptomyces sp. B27]|uniref:hypothetical protein n=1 Tax=Streptomyces sp. B27 TaxID=2485015 RepID=UPI000FD86AD0|nr:hypothetical protein [Streptomyces sp. B27]